jgi:uncharacterized OsmC-like protein
MDISPSLNDEQVVNGICLQFANMIRDEVKLAPELAEGHWRVDSEWTGQTGSVSEISNSQIGGDDISRSFSIKMDQPHELCGGNSFASPQEHLLAALSGCFIANFSAVCALRCISLNSIKIHMSGTTDMRGLFDISGVESSHFKDIKFVVSVAGNASPEELQSVYEHVVKISPNLGGVGRATAIQTELSIIEK